MDEIDRDVWALLKASLERLDASDGLDMPAVETKSIAMGAKQAAEIFKIQSQQIAESLARFGDNLQVNLKQDFERLTPSQKTHYVKKLAASGVTQKRIAELLVVTQSAVSQHLHKKQKNVLKKVDALRKSGVSNTVILAMLREHGLVIDAVDLDTFIVVYQKITSGDV